MLPLTDIVMPVNIGLVFNILMKIAAIDVINTDTLYRSMFNFEETEALSDNFRLVGFESLWQIYNLGSIALFVAAIPLMLFLLRLTKHCNRIPKLQSACLILEGKMYYNFFIRFIMESYLMITLSCIINSKHIVWNTVATTFNSLLVIATFLIITLYPVGMILILSKYFKQLTTKGLKAQFGTIYKNLNFRKGKIIIFHIYFFFLRRILLAFSVVYLTGSITYQNLVMFLSTQVQIMLIAGSNVYTTAIRNKVETLNEVVVFLCIYCTFLFTDFVPDAKVKFALGYFFSGLILTQLSVTIGCLFIKDFKRMKHSYKLKYHLKKQKKDINSRNRDKTERVS